MAAAKASTTVSKKRYEQFRQALDVHLTDSQIVNDVCMIFKNVLNFDPDISSYPCLEKKDEYIKACVERRRKKYQENPELHETHKEQIRKVVRERYANDPEYRNKKILSVKLAKERNKQKE